VITAAAAMLASTPLMTAPITAPLA
jgi:hypothetical protein